MNTDVPQTTKKFEEIKHTDQDKEYWYARELMPLLGYKKWANFRKVIEKARNSFRSNSQEQRDHLAEVSKKIKIATGTKKESTRKVTDFRLSRYACYVIAQNGDSSKKPIAEAQAYFAIQTRRQEITDDLKKIAKRYRAREKLRETEKKFGGVLRSSGVDNFGIAEIKSSGDEALFGRNTRAMKDKFGVSTDRPLADYLPTIALKAKDLATELTTFQTNKKNLRGKTKIKTEHVHNNSEIRNLLTSNGIYPEKLQPQEDIKKLERRLKEFELDIDMDELESINLEKIEIDIREIEDRGVIEQLAELIKAYPGSTVLTVYYGEPVKSVDREITLNSEVYNFLSKYFKL